MTNENNEEYIGPSAAEEDVVYGRCLKTAYDIIGPITDSTELSTLVRGFVRAVLAIHKILAAESEAFCETHAGHACHGFYANEGHIVASAYYARISDLPIAEMHPTSVAGGYLMGVLFAGRILSHISEIGAISTDLAETDSSPWFLDSVDDVLAYITPDK